jgi:hypothetical protein
VRAVTVELLRACVGEPRRHPVALSLSSSGDPFGFIIGGLLMGFQPSDGA